MKFISRNRAKNQLLVLSLLLLVFVAASGLASNSTISSTSKATQARQSPMSAASAIMGALGSLVPGIISNVAPLVLLAGLGALLMPQLSVSAMGLLRESRRSAQDVVQSQLPFGALAPNAAHFQLARPLQSSPQDIYYFTKRSLGSSPSRGFPSSSYASSWMPNSEQLMHGLQEVLERVSRALENAEKRYN